MVVVSDRSKGKFKVLFHELSSLKHAFQAIKKSKSLLFLIVRGKIDFSGPFYHNSISTLIFSRYTQSKIDVNGYLHSNFY